MKKDKSVSDLKPGQQATLFPSLAFYDAEKDSTRAFVHGRVFVGGKIPIRTRLMLKALKKTMKASPEDLASETFQRRIEGFLTAPGRRRRIVLDVGQHRYRLKKRTRRNGAFYGLLTLPDNALSSPEQSQTLRMDLLRSNDSQGAIQPSRGRMHYVPPKGVSIISDIDDTIKMTDATCRQEMLANTFLRPFEVVAGMKDLYREWQNLGAEFHYVSSSPWQLYEPLAELCDVTGFPAGSMHLRYFRARDEMFKRFRPIRRHSKVAIIGGILKCLPERKFVLVGDSGEKDPEIYRFIARRYPKNIAAILIRNLDARPLSEKRMRKLMVVRKTAQIRVFQATSEIENVVGELLN